LSYEGLNNRKVGQNLSETMNRLKEKYLKEIKKVLKEELSLTSDLSVPKVDKIVVNIGSSEAKDNEEILSRLQNNLTIMTGQKPVVTRAKKSISAFKLTKGAPIGLMVTLRGEKMYAFLDKLISTVLPKVRDFRGVSSTAFDGRGNFNLGLREQMIFPEVDMAAASGGFKNNDKIRGLQITVVTTAKNSEEGKRLLELLGMPFWKEVANR
jgi:large subunit ribosomal protein L5